MGTEIPPSSVLKIVTGVHSSAFMSSIMITNVLQAIYICPYDILYFVASI
jgi:hypothetical protein